MLVTELNRDQLIELKGNYIDNYLYENEGRGASYGELASADELVSDEKIFEEYESYDFSMDDFGCTAGKDSPDELKEKLDDITGDIRYNISAIKNMSEPIDYDIDLHYFINSVQNYIDELENLATDYEDTENELKNWSE